VRYYAIYRISYAEAYFIGKIIGTKHVMTVNIFLPDPWAPVRGGR
jgi:hypothetical protein